MDTTMELDELKHAWQALGRQLERQEAIQWQLLRERKLERVRHGLRPLVWGQVLQMLLGLGLIALGVACWTGNAGVPGLFWSGVLVHAFGVAHVALGGITLGLVGTIDYSAPVLRIQKQMARLRSVYAVNANVCGAPWWVLWVLVVIGFAGLSPTHVAGPTPLWIWISLGIGILGTLATWLWAAKAARKPDSLYARLDDGTDGIRRSLRLFDEIDMVEHD